ncbi:unnamed protein product [Darwinula stevensoni]|uniref:DBF4-type domain-containing protein n=1 Tax=Darwinula stevensoni TaxID=69355 RepID=A0A7R9A3A6_9CRUS|nr:unnamed protein product [Darwinula stevensoni]CAG0880926.1 unnamed protein product [Darwinula stevensoni]
MARERASPTGNLLKGRKVYLDISSQKQLLEVKSKLLAVGAKRAWGIWQPCPSPFSFLALRFALCSPSQRGNWLRNACECTDGSFDEGGNTNLLHWESLAALPEVEEFFSREVHAVVSSRPESVWFYQQQQQQKQGQPVKLQESILNLPSPSPGYVPSPSSCSSSIDDGGCGARGPLGNRGSAMLAKAIRSKASISKTLETAQQFGIAIWPLARVLALLEKAHNLPTARRGAKEALKRVTARPLRSPFLKVEDKSRKYRPLYKEFSVWPKLLRFVRSAGSPFHFTSQPFSNEPLGEKKVEVKKFEKPTRQRSSPRKPLPSASTLKKPATGKSGYCEICNVTFRCLEEHLETPKHKAYVVNDSHYHCIDQLIPGHQDFQDLIASELQVVCKAEAGMVSSSPSAEHKNLIAEAPEPRRSSLRLLAHRGKSYNEGEGMNGIQSDDEDLSLREKIRIRSHRHSDEGRNNCLHSSIKTRARHLTSSSDGAGETMKLNGMMNGNLCKRRPMSRTEKFLRDNVEYYKLQVLSSKLRSTDHLMRMTNESEDFTRRGRMHPDLALLIDNQEYYKLETLPGKLRASSLSPRHCEDTHIPLEKPKQENPPLPKTMASPHEDSDIVVNVDCASTEEKQPSCSSPKRRPGRRELEQLLEDNKEILDLTLSDSRLRSSPPECGLLKPAFSDCDHRLCQSEPPLHEGDSVAPDMSYLFDQHPPVDPCVNYHSMDFQRFWSEPDTLKPFPLPFEMSFDVVLRQAQLVRGSKNNASAAKRRPLSVAEMHRKSPRCHASTQAILSQLKISQEVNPEEPVTDAGLADLAQGIEEEIINGSIEDMEDLQEPGALPPTMSSGRGKRARHSSHRGDTLPISIDTSHISLDFLARADECECALVFNGMGEDCSTSECSSVGSASQRDRKRKKVYKPNRTGWPKNKKKRKVEKVETPIQVPVTANRRRTRSSGTLDPKDDVLDASPKPKKSESPKESSSPGRKRARIV